MIHVIGGVYREKCFLDMSEELYGSGGRAAFALSCLSDDVELSTYVCSQAAKDLRVISDCYGVRINEKLIKKTISFEYFHALSRPQIFPSDYDKVENPPIIVEAECVLRFGMVEGEAIIRGNWVVYDPQSPSTPRWFHTNGSQAENLAYVLNLREGELLTQKKKLEEIVECIVRAGATVVVLKMGSNGTVISDGHELKYIPCVPTDTVKAIGSGDIFSAAFAHFWAEKQYDVFESAELAAKATAFYCNQGALPIPKAFVEQSRGGVELQDYNEMFFAGQKRAKVYLAAPFFNMAEIWMVEECRNLLLSFGLDVFSPYHDIGIGPAEDVAVKDIEALDECHVVLAILNGLDSGTIFEIGYAKAKNIPVIVFVQNEKPEDLKMISGTGCIVVDDFVTAIYKTAWAGNNL